MELKDALKDMASSAQTAFGEMRTLSGKSNDRDIIRYESLTNADFDQMRQDFGDDEVINYIREMEIRRMKSPK